MNKLISNVSVKVYVAQPMTGYTKKEAYSKALKIKRHLESYGIKVLSPVLDCGILPSKETILSIPSSGFLKEWKRDKELIREAHVLLDVDAEVKSEGVAHECAYMRYFLWRGVVRISQKYVSKGCSVAIYEDDFIASNLDIASKEIVRRWGSKPKRLWWKIKILTKGIPKFIVYQLQGLLR